MSQPLRLDRTGLIVMSAMLTVLAVALIARGGEADILPRLSLQTGRAPCEVSREQSIANKAADHPIGRANLARAASTGRPVIDYGNLNGVLTEWTFAPDGAVSWRPAVPQVPVAQPQYVPPAPEVAPPARQPFRAGTTFVAGSEWGKHSCPVCGAQRWKIDGWATDGEHFHACPNPACVDANGRHTYWKH
jgi:hypothetical protein